MEELRQFGIIPIDFRILSSILYTYRSIGDKIYHLEKEGSLIRLKKGMFVVSPEITKKTISRELIANHLYGPSYVSLESALSYYGLIPEKVFSVRSVTSKRSKKFNNSLGSFDFFSVPEVYFSVGIRQQIINNEYAYLIATPEKAICDMILATKGFRIQSPKAMKIFLENDLRLDFSAINSFDKSIIENCIQFGKKKNELTYLLEILG